MKYSLVLLSLLVAGCAAIEPPKKKTTGKLSGLDSERYQVIDIRKFDNQSTSCGKDKLLQCLGVSEGTCHKIYRAAAVECFDKFYTDRGIEADICSPNNKDFIDGCMYINVLKYAEGGVDKAIECLKST